MLTEMQSLSPSRDLQVWKKHQLQRWLEHQDTLSRVEKQRSARKEESKDSEKATRLAETRERRAREGQRQVRVESSREREAQVKKLQELRLCALQQKVHSNYSRLREAREAKSHLLREQDLQLTTRLQLLQHRLDKSQEIHTAALQSRSQSAAQRRFHTSNLRQSSDRLREYVKKVQGRQQKGSEAKTEELLKREGARKARAERWRQVESKRQQEELKVQQWTQALESKHSTQVRLSVKSHSARSEHLRELQDLCSQNRERMRRMQTERQADLMLRWVDKGKRLEQLKMQRALSVQRKCEIQRFDMLEREKTYSLLERVAHSPSSVQAHRLLKQLNSLS